MWLEFFNLNLIFLFLFLPKFDSMWFRKISFVGTVIGSIFISNMNAQNRITDRNNIGWYAANATIKLDSKFSALVEYQWRRNNYISDWQQGLLRFGLNYQALPNLQLRAGYAWAETFPYGEIPINGMGKDFTEHRIYEAATITGKISFIDLSHRFMLEQRWVGRYTNPSLTKEDEFTYHNRIRYMARLQAPLKGKSITDKTPYLVIYDEVMLGFGKNTGENVFDQNRIGILLGYQFNKNFRLEGGYLNQIIQLGREIDGKNVYQKNNGFLLSTSFTIDTSKGK